MNLTALFRRAGILTVGASALTTSAGAQRPTTIPGTEQLAVTSERTGLAYRIDVSLPPDYAKSGATRYPVLFILDGNLAFGTAVEAQRMVAIDRLVPGLIIVGVGYPEDDPAVYTPTYAANRTRDYTPTAPATAPEGGKAAEFLAFLRDQLIPLIDRTYRTDPADRALGGHSFGGLFTTYALLHQPDLFRRYWIGSPSLWWDRQVAFGWLAGAPAPAKGTRVFLTVGEKESDLMVKPMQRLAAGLASRFPGLVVDSRVYPDERHGSVVGAAISSAMRVLYRRATIPIAPADAQAYLGRWKAASGATFLLLLNRGRLAVRDSAPGLSFIAGLEAAARDDLFDESLGVRYLVSRDARGKPAAITRTGLGPDTLFTRVR